MILSHHFRVSQTVTGNGYLTDSGICISIWILLVGYVFWHSNFGPIPHDGVGAAHQSFYPRNCRFQAIFHISVNPTILMIWMWYLVANHHFDVLFGLSTQIFSVQKFLFIKLIWVPNSNFFRLIISDPLLIFNFWCFIKLSDLWQHYGPRNFLYGPTFTK